MRRSGNPLLAVFVLVPLATSCSRDDYVQLFADAPRAPSLTDDGIRQLDHLGALRVDQGVNFGVYAANATRVDLLLFDDPESTLATREYTLSRFGDVWNIYVEGLGSGQHYGFRAFGPNWPAHSEWFPGAIDGFIADVDPDGHRYNPNKLLLDPYARRLHRDHDWSKGSVASGPARTELTYAAASKAVLVDSTYEWSAHEAEWRDARQSGNHENHRWTDLVIYEVHPKGFTADSASGVDHPGTYRGFGEMAPYLADLGINAVELMPIHEKPLDGGYWGYQTLNFFTPEREYAFDQELAGPIDEFKAMVDQLHQHGIEVIIDVVYNHTGEGGFWRDKIEETDTVFDPRAELINADAKEVASIYSYRGLDNVSYYGLAPDPQFYWNNTGVGNQTRPNHTPMRRLIMDSLRYWVEEMHVDGFRFDLAPVLGETDGDYNLAAPSNETVLQEIIDDPILQKYQTRIISEPWSIVHFRLGGNNYGFPVASNSPDGEVAWYDWNGKFRDYWRAMFNYDDWRLSCEDGYFNYCSAGFGGCSNGAVDGGNTLTGSSALFAAGNRRPYHSVNFITVHDGFPLYDLFTYDCKRNACGPLNPACCAEPNSPFCDRNSGEDNNRSRDWGADNEAMKRQLARNAFVIMMVAHGTPMLFGGDEWLRTQLGNNNAYSQKADNSVNWFQWGVWQADNDRRRMHDFVRQAVAMRHTHRHAFAPETYGGGAPFAWKNELNQDMGSGNWAGRHVMMHYYDATSGPELLVLINMELGNVDFALPAGRTWVRLLDTQQWFDRAPYLDGKDLSRSHNINLTSPEAVATSSYGVPSRSIVVLRAE